ncbi:hypothetical protein Bbelb_183410 [Branchiostoma belcheri]|nr:hypothetical protein Bbelb_183410 [Branchiostoma belcheri]
MAQGYSGDTAKALGLLEDLKSIIVKQENTIRVQQLKVELLSSRARELEAERDVLRRRVDELSRELRGGRTRSQFSTFKPYPSLSTLQCVYLGRRPGKDLDGYRAYSPHVIMTSRPLMSRATPFWGYSAYSEFPSIEMADKPPECVWINNKQRRGHRPPSSVRTAATVAGQAPYAAPGLNTPISDEQRKTEKPILTT